MTFQQELSSWFSLNHPTVAEPPQIGSKAPETPKIQPAQGRPAVITFLRHCGCPWAEKTFLNIREIAGDHRDIDFIAVSHSDQESTDNWLKALPQAGSEPANVKVVVDAEVEAYAAWGLGPASWAHVLSPWQLWNVYKLGQTEQIWNRPTESGSRWQMSGSYAVDAEHIVRWGRPMNRADEVPDFGEAVECALGRAESKL